MSHEPLIFEDSAPVEIPVQVKKKWYILREAMQGEAVKFKDRQLAATEFNQQTNIGKIRGLAESEPYLVSLCLHIARVNEKGEPYLTDDGTYAVEKRIDPNSLNAWHHRIVKRLFAKAQEISHLREEEETTEELRKKIEELQKRLEELQAEETPVKNLPDDLTQKFGLLTKSEPLS
jgi:hypothetical protein